MSTQTLKRPLALLLALGSLSLLAATGVEPEALSGGAYSSLDFGQQAFMHTRMDAPEADLKRLDKGRDAFSQRWVVPFLNGGPWGRGPVSNAESCVECHERNGRGSLPASVDEPIKSTLVRLSMPGSDEHGGPKAHPRYGFQLNSMGILDRVPAEGQAYVRFTEREEELADGEVVKLRIPHLTVKDLAFGPLEPTTLVGLRTAPPVFGMGLLEAVAEADILALVKRDKPQGIGGKANIVWDIEMRRNALGRFGLKANQPSLTQQIQAAFFDDLGVTSHAFPTENCMPPQSACKDIPPGGRPELTYVPYEAIQTYLRMLAVPARRGLDQPLVRQGEQLFAQAQCDACHVPELKTGPYRAMPALAGQTIHPYTDLLLHDMGEELSDGRPDYLAGPRDWRTPPLWGLGLHAAANGQTSLLHDGRARNPSEAILWHGGEATAAREAFRNMPKGERAALLAFLGSL